MKIKFLILCFLGLVVLIGCKKATQTSGSSSVNGQVIDQTTGKGVPYAAITLIGQNSNVIGAIGQQQLKDTTTDVNGNFSFSFNYAGGNTYTLQAEAPNYFLYGNPAPILSQGQNNNVKVKIAPEGWVRFYLVNGQPLDTLIEFVLDDFNNAPTLQNIYKNTSFIVYGFGNTVTHFTYKMDKGGFVTHNDSIYVKALDTVTFTINY